VPTSSDIFWFLLVLVALLWPLDVALRRLTKTRAQAAATVRGWLRCAARPTTWRLRRSWPLATAGDYLSAPERGFASAAGDWLVGQAGRGVEEPD